ncbi:MAG TPA: response regulator [Ktedonobacteraceae bacterium]|nr:response regulator [Ktedonobacteraceae bacterium]
MEDARQTEAEDASSPIKTVLIVEDDEDIGLALSQVLKEETHYQVVVATDGFQALKIIHTIQPDLFVVDYHLPEMNGLEFVDTLRAKPEYARTPMLLMSARPPWPDLAQRQLLCLEKPFELDIFVLQIKELLLA